MAADSKSFKLSLKRCRTPSRRRESSPRSSSSSKESPSRKIPTTDRAHNTRYRLRGRCTDKGMHRAREDRQHLRKGKPVRRISSYDRYSDSKCLGEYPKYRDGLFEKDKVERHRHESSANVRHLRGVYNSKTYENRNRRESKRRLSRCSRERSRSRDRIRHEENYDDRETHRSFARLPMTLPEIYECPNAQSRLVYPHAFRRPPLPVAAPRPTRILLPPPAPLMRLPFPARVIRAVPRPVLLAPVVILRPLRPQI